MKKLISALLVLTMVFAMLPTLALVGSAEGEGVIVLPGDCFHSRLSYTANQDGTTHTVTCLDCGAVINASQAHTFSGGTCTLCGAEEPVADPYLDPNLGFMRIDLLLESYIGAGFTVNKKNLSYASYYVVFEYTRDGVDHSDQAELEVLGKNYLYGVHKVAAKEMTDILSATLYGVTAGGDIYHGNTIEWNVRSAMEEKIAASANNSEIALCVAILKYGAAAQTNFNYKTDDLADKNLTAAQIATLGEGTPAVSVLSDSNNGLTGITYTRMSLSAEATIVVNPIFKFAAGYSPSNVVARVSYTDSTGTPQVAEFTGDAIQQMGKNYYFAFDKMAAKQMRDSFQITFYDLNENAISETRTYSIASYIADSLASAPANTAALLQACLNYGDAAAAYFAG